MRSEQTEPDEAYADEALTIPAEQVCFLIVKAREFDVKEGDSELEFRLQCVRRSDGFRS